jgi:hypothetical protein
VIDTDVGRIGIMLGRDALYPEAGRILAYQGAQILLGLGACPGAGLHRKVRAGLAARVQENQLYGMASFLVGHNPLGLDERPDFAGQSAIFAPAELTPSHSGVMVQMGTASSEGVITAEWDFEALEALWVHSDTPLRWAMPMASLHTLGDRYQSGRTLHHVWEDLQAIVPEVAVPEAAPLDVLPEPAQPEPLRIPATDAPPQPPEPAQPPEVLSVDMLPEVAVAGPEVVTEDAVEEEVLGLEEGGEADVGSAGGIVADSGDADVSDADVGVAGGDVADAIVEELLAE